jgi:hypothetical protein
VPRPAAKPKHRGTPHGHEQQTAPSDATGTVELPWYERQLSSDWTTEEVRFFCNWSKELKGLHDVFAGTAVGRLKLLRRARRVYFKLAHKLTVEIRRIKAKRRQKAVPKTQPKPASECE